MLARLSQLAFWLPLAIATFAAFAPQGVPLPFSMTDVALHLFTFTYLTAALGNACFRLSRWWVPAPWMLVYGVLLELVQSLIPARSAELKDIAVDVSGIAIGLVVWRFVLVPLMSRPQP
jgi:VanZ family protein